MGVPVEEQAAPSQRLDKWLWAARFFKTRNLAIAAINGGKVHVDGQRVKPARAVRRGAEIRIHKGSLEITVTVQGLSAQRRPASEATLLYEETEESQTRRETLAERRRADTAYREHGTGRPTKRDRRQLGRLTGR